MEILQFMLQMFSRWVPVDRGFLLVGNNNDNNSCSVQQRMLELGLENRDITENDYDLLMQLDQSDVPNNPGTNFCIL